MCIYCYCGDHMWRHDPPWEKPEKESDTWPWHPLVPKPVNPQKTIIPWDLNRLREFRDLLKQIHELEEKIGCPCEPNKADYLQLLKKRIESLEKKEKKSKGKAFKTGRL